MFDSIKPVNRLLSQDWEEEKAGRKGKKYERGGEIPAHI